MVLEKIIAPIIKRVTDGTLSAMQFRAKESSDCMLAKLLLVTNAAKNQRTKMLLLDISKAFDSIEREELARRVERKYGSEATIIIQLLKLYESFTIILDNKEINSLRGLFQGSTFGALLFCIYVENQIRADTNVHIQAYIDDIAIQAGNMKDLQDSYNILRCALKSSGLEVNFDKCVLVTEDTADTIEDDETG